MCCSLPGFWRLAYWPGVRGGAAVSDFGGMGGIMGGRERDPADLFEAAIARAFGKRLRKQGRGPGWPGANKRKKKLGQRLWGALSNVDWEHENGDTAGYSFRAAGDLIASVVGDGDYMDWYCSACDGFVDGDIEEAMAKLGWRPVSP